MHGVQIFTFQIFVLKIRNQYSIVERNPVVSQLHAYDILETQNS